jgi:hypothetical protein
MATGAALASLVWSLAFPIGFWFLKLWAGISTGGLLGLVLGMIWQLRDDRRRSQTSGKFLMHGMIALGLFSAVALFLMAPMMRAEQKQCFVLRSLDLSRISEARVSVQGREECRILDREKLDSFVTLAKNAEPFRPDHEGALMSFKLTLIPRGDSPLEYEGRIPTKHTDDIALQFRAGAMLKNEILIKGGRKWLEDGIR